jgi:hypothetical protein
VPALGHRHVGVEHAPRDADGDAAEAAGVEQRRADGIDRALLAPFLLDVARRRVGVGDEQVLDRVAVAAGATQAEHVPVVDDLGLAAQEDERAVVGPAVADVRRAVGVLHGAVGAQHPGVAPAARKAPGAGQAIATLDADRLALVVARAPRQAGIGTVEHRRRRLVRHRGGRGRHRHVRLVDEPGRAGVSPGQRLVGLAVVDERHLLPAHALGQQQAQQVLAGKCCDHLLGELAAAVHLRPVQVQHRLHGPRPLLRAGKDWRNWFLHQAFPRASIARL